MNFKIQLHYIDSSELIQCGKIKV